MLGVKECIKVYWGMWFRSMSGDIEKYVKVCYWAIGECVRSVLGVY